jgi:hypothetical protein
MGICGWIWMASEKGASAAGNTAYQGKKVLRDSAKPRTSINLGLIDVCDWVAKIAKRSNCDPPTAQLANGSHNGGAGG